MGSGKIRFDRVSLAYGGGDPGLRVVSLAFGPAGTRDVGAHGGGDPVVRDVSPSFGAAGTGVVGANGAGKTTLVRLATGALAPGAGVIARAPQGGLCVVCEQRVDRAGAEVRALAAADDAEAGR